MIWLLGIVLMVAAWLADPARRISAVLFAAAGLCILAGAHLATLPIVVGVVVGTALFVKFCIKGGSR